MPKKLLKTPLSEKIRLLGFAREGNLKPINSKNGVDFKTPKARQLINKEYKQRLADAKKISEYDVAVVMDRKTIKTWDRNAERKKRVIEIHKKKIRSYLKKMNLIIKSKEDSTLEQKFREKYIHFVKKHKLKQIKTQEKQFRTLFVEGIGEYILKDQNYKKKVNVKEALQYAFSFAERKLPYIL
jgi:hypothetical protein